MENVAIQKLETLLEEKADENLSVIEGKLLISSTYFNLFHKPCVAFCARITLSDRHWIYWSQDCENQKYYENFHCGVFECQFHSEISKKVFWKAFFAFSFFCFSKIACFLPFLTIFESKKSCKVFRVRVFDCWRCKRSVYIRLIF